MTDEPRDIERQIDETRNAMDETIDALSERLSLRNLGDRAMDAVVRHAPTPPDGGRAFYRRRPLVVGSVALAAGIGAGFLLSPPSTGKTRHGPGLMTRMKANAKATMHDATQMVRERTHDARENVMQKAHDAREKVSERAHAAKDTAATATRVAKDEAKELAQTAKESPSRALDEGKEAVRHVKDRTKDEARRQGLMEP